MKPKEVLGSFDCLNKNALLGAALRSTGLIINEKLRQSMVTKMDKVVLLSMLYVRKKYYYFKYWDIAETYGEYDKWTDLFNSKEFYWFTLLNEDNDFAKEDNKKFEKRRLGGGVYEEAKNNEGKKNEVEANKDEKKKKPKAEKKPQALGRAIIQILAKHFHSETEPYKLDADKLRKYTIKPDTTDKLLDFCSERSKTVEGGIEDIVSFVNRRSTYKDFEEMFEAEVSPEYVSDFNKKYNGEKLVWLLQVINLSIANEKLHANYNRNQYDEAMEALKNFDPPAFKNNTYDIEVETDSHYKELNITAKTQATFFEDERIVRGVGDNFRNLYNLVRLQRFYREWQKLKDLPHKSILTNFKDGDIIIDGRKATIEEIQQIVDDLNYNSPLVKQDIKVAMARHFYELFMTGLYYYKRVQKQRDKGKDIADYLTAEAFEGYQKWVRDRGGVNSFVDYEKTYADAIKNAEFEFVPWLRKILLKDDRVTDIFIDDSDDGTPIHELFKFVMCYNMGNKVFKQLSGYIDGQLPKESVPLGEVKEDGTILTATEETGAKGYRLYKPEFGVNSLATKRWKAGIQTLTQGSDAFRLIEAEDNHVAVYFDISQAEVRVAAFMSGDKRMIDMYNNGIDLYIEMSKRAFPNQKDPAFHKAQRQTFKAVVLGVLYGRGGKSVAEAIGVSIDEAYRLIDTFHKMFPTLADWIEKKKEFCKDNNGRIDTILGDRLVSDASKSMTTGINWVIQSFAATMLAEGFYNLYYQSYKDKTYVIPKVVVHDSVTVTTHAKNFFATIKNIDRYFKQYIFDKYGIPLKYDMLTMKNFRDKCEFKWNEETQLLEITGSEIGVDAWVRTMSQHYKFKLIDESIVEVHEVKVLENMIANNQIETFAYYPERDYIVPNKINRTYKVTAK